MAAPIGIGDFIAWDGGCLMIGKALRVVPRHAHQAIQIVFGHAGPIALRDGDAGRWVEHTLGLIPSRQPHSMDATRASYNAIIFVEPETPAGRALAGRCPRGGIAALDDPGAARAAAALFAGWLGGACREDLIAGARRVVDALTRGEAPPVVTDERISWAVAHIQTGLQRAITLEEVARHVHLSPSRCRHLFREQTGMGLRPYVLWRRFLHAWSLLAAGASVTAAAHGAGFADAAHFTRTSRATFGFAPSLLTVQDGRKEDRP